MSKGHILIVEDDADVANALRIYFSLQDYETTVVERGREALSQCKRQLPHAVVLDIMLPDIDGYEVCTLLRANLRTSHIPIIFLTQKDTRSDKIAGLALGADDYITKPFDMEELYLRVQGAIRRAERENLTSPTTGLPTGKLVKEQLRLAARKKGAARLSIHINDLEPFNEKYGFVAVNEVLRLTALLISETVDEVGAPDDFIGHTGDDDFIVISTLEKSEAIAQRLTEHFNAKAGTHYEFNDRQAGQLTLDNRHYPFMSLAIDIAPSDK